MDIRDTHTKLSEAHKAKLSRIKKRLYKEGKLTHCFSKTEGYNREKTQFKKGHIQSKENIRKMLKNRKTVNETRLEVLLLNNGLKYKFVGDGTVILENTCPDFINVNGQKKIIELVGGGLKSNMDSKIEIYKKYGYTTLVIYLRLLNENPEEVLKRVGVFDNE